MRISNATIDCFLTISAAGYSDKQHHHWEIMPSGPIGAGTVKNIPTYTWAVDCIGSDSNGSWSTPVFQSVSITNGAEALITVPPTATMPGTISLKQTTGFGTNKIQAIGNLATKHDVSEMIWATPSPNPKDLITWSTGAGTPSMITYQDMGNPIVTLQLAPWPLPGSPQVHTVVFPSQPGQIQTGGFVATLVITSASFVVAGGQDWTNGLATFYQPPSPRTALAWWKWTINLVP
jgi:hypothetical protein